jgi:hypothetical protein
MSSLESDYDRDTDTDGAIRDTRDRKYILAQGSRGAEGSPQDENEHRETWASRWGSIHLSTKETVLYSPVMLGSTTLPMNRIHPVVFS